MTALSDTFENKLIDFLFRGQALGVTGASAAAGSGPATLYVGLFTTSPADAGGGVECSGNAYARASIASSLANWAGTQGAGTTAASNGSSGQTSNNSPINFTTPTPGSWGTVVAWGIFDAATGGNMLAWAPLTASVVINANQPVSFPAGSLTFQIDN